jgi:uncharacterized membrane protein (UPF0127 family)
MRAGKGVPLIFFLALGLAFILVVVINQNLGGNFPFLDIFKQNSSLMKPSSVEKRITVGGAKIFVEVADSPKKRAKGLSGRNTLAENEGMLFVFNEKDTIPSFWMKGMLFPIDIVWIADNQVVQIDSNVQPEPDTPDAKLKHYRPLRPVDYVLEVSAGFSSKNSIKSGDTVNLSAIEPN